MSVWTAGSTGSVFIKEPALQAEALKSVQGGREKTHGLLGVFLCVFFFLILLHGMDLASRRLNTSTCPTTEIPALRGRIISHQIKGKHTPVLATTMELPMMGQSWPET